jgi:hypothetical protein
MYGIDMANDTRERLRARAIPVGGLVTWASDNDVVCVASRTTHISSKHAHSNATRNSLTQVLAGAFSYLKFWLFSS